jgi:hypothetical protein
MTSTATLDGITVQEPTEAGFDAAGDPVDDFAGGEQSWPTPGTAAAQGGHGQQVGRATPSAAAEDDAAVAVAQDDGAAKAGTDEPQAEIEFPEHLLSDAGLTAEAARQQFKTPEALELALNFHLQQVINAGRQRAPAASQATQLPAGLQGLALPPQGAPPQADGGQAVGGQAVGAPQALPIKGWYKPFAEVAKAMKDGDGDPIYADETIRLIEAMDAHNAAQFDALTNALGPMVMRTHQGFQQFAIERAAQATEQHYLAMERRFAELGDEWAETFGKGDARDLVQANAADPGVQARVRLAETMEAIKQGRARMGLAAIDDDTLFQQALRADFHSKLQDLHQRGIQDKRAGRNHLRTMRPTQRKTPARSQNERTLQAVETMLQQRGRSLGPPSEEALIDGF